MTFIKKISFFSIIVILSITGFVFANCYPGNALEFDGQDDYVDLGDTVKNYLGTDYTVSAWVNPYTVFRSGIIVAYRSQPYVPRPWPVLFQLDHYNADVRFTVRDNSENTAQAIFSNAITAGNWCHIVGVRAGNILNVYVNGMKGTPASTKFGEIKVNNLKMGVLYCCYAGLNYFFDGLIDEVAIFDRAFSDEEVQQLYCCDSCVLGLSPVAYWNLDENQGQMVFDISGYNNHGYLGIDPDIDDSDPTRVESGVPINEFYVDDDAPDDPCHGIPGALVGDPCFSDPLENGTICRPFDSIQKAIDRAANHIRGCHPNVIASDGVYAGVGNYDIDTLGLAMTIKSENGPNNCIIDCKSLGKGFIIQNGESLDTLIDGFTIIDGYAAECAGAIDCNNSSPTINNCIIEGNYANWSGGAIFCQDSNAEITNCTITDNFCEASGAGICGVGGFPVIKNCLIANNDGYFSGGVGSVYDCNMTIINCTIADNTASHSYLSTGGVYCWQGDANIINTIVWNNNSPGSEQIEFFMGNEICKVTYSDIQIEDSNLVWEGTGNLNDDPCFAAPKFGDYHLKSTAGRWAQILDSTADLNDDGIVDWLDLGIFVENWLYTGEEIYIDLYREGSIDFRDFDVFACNWRAVGQNKADFSENNLVDWVDLRIFTEYWLDTGREIPVDLYYEASIDFKDYAVLALDWLHPGWIYSDTETSLCIDAGDPAYDYTLEPEPNGEIINMGTYGNTEFASKSQY